MSRVRLTVAIALALTFATAATASAAPGDLDPSFGTYGKFLSPTKDETGADKVVVMPDGRIVVGGFSRTGATIFGFTAAGQPDTSFGQGGQVALPSTRGEASLALQGDNIVAAASDNTGRLVVFRLQPNGALDPSFGSAGVAATSLSSGGPTPQVAVGADRRIVVASTSAPISGLVITRLLPDGDGFDPSFGGGVVYVTSPLGFAAQAIAAGPGDGVTVLSAGFAETSRMLRFAADGTPDPSFGSGGEVAVQAGGPVYLYDMALRPDGSSVVVGYLTSSRKGVIASLSPAGQLDPAFATDGATEPPANEIPHAVGFDSQGRILAAGSGSNGLSLIRYLPNGSLDTSFGANGVASGRFGRLTSVGRALALMPDGRIVVAAERITGFRSDHVVLGVMRFLVADGPSDPDADGVLGKRDRCPALGGTARNRGCPIVAREIELKVRPNGIKGTVRSDDRQCNGIDKVAVFGVQPGQDDLLGRFKVKHSGLFRVPLGPGFDGRVYARLGGKISPAVGLCGAARSNQVSAG